MSYEHAAQLQAEVFRRLSENAELALLVGSAIYDEPLQHSSAIDHSYVTIGEETVRPFDTTTSSGAYHDFDVKVYSGRNGFEIAKRIAASVCDCLLGVRAQFSGSQILDIRFLRAKAQRGRSPVKRTITLRFRAVIDVV